jgi:DNA-binding MarR family transcriptional regulator
VSTKMAGVNETRWLTASEDRAWRGYRRMFLLLNRQIAEELARDTGLSEADYDVLSNLSESPRPGVRLTELATHMRWSNSRLSHHVTRMQQRGLVVRRESPSDARAAVIGLTDQGRRTIQRAAPHHVESVRRHFIERLSPEQIEMFADLSWAIVDHLTNVETP